MGQGKVSHIYSLGWKVMYITDPWMAKLGREGIFRLAVGIFT